MRALLEDPRPERVDQLWAQVVADGTPLVEQVESGRGVVTFMWRGSATSVMLLANKVIDPRDSHLALFERVPGSDLWHLGLVMGLAWRSSYAIAPMIADEVPAEPDRRLQLRRERFLARTEPADVPAVERWFDHLGRQRRDPLNRTPLNARLSVVSLPHAPATGHWRPTARAAGESSVPAGGRLPGSRLRIGCRVPEGADPRTGPMILLLDASEWVEAGVEAAAVGELGDQPVSVIEVETPPPRRRAEVLTGPDLAHELAVDVLDRVRTRYGRRRPIVLAAQSLAAVAAVRLAAVAPHAVEGLVLLSPSLWWPGGGEDPGEVIGQLGTVTMPVHVSVGSSEHVLLSRLGALSTALDERAGPSKLSIFDGGHDLACWRGELRAALAWLPQWGGNQEEAP